MVNGSCRYWGIWRGSLKLVSAFIQYLLNTQFMKHSSAQPSCIFSPFPERPLNSFVFPGFWQTLWPNAMRSSWTTPSSRTLRYKVATWTLGVSPCAVWFVSFPVCSRWDLSPFNWMGPTTIISSISLSYLEFHLFAWMVKTYYLNV